MHVTLHHSSLLRLYIRAAIAKRTASKQECYPPLAVELIGVQANPKKLAQYRSLFGLPEDTSMPCVYPHILAFRLHLSLLLSDDFPFPLLGLVHVRNQFTQYQNIEDEKILDINCSLEGLTVVERGKEFDIRTKVFESGNLVWESTTTLLYLCDTTVIRSKTKKDTILVPTAESSWAISENTGRRYAKVSGDWNLIHLHATIAKLFGFKRGVAHGMWAKAKILSEIANQLPSTPFNVDVEFKLPLYIPENLLFQYSVQNGNIDFNVKDKRGRLIHIAGTVTTL